MPGRLRDTGLIRLHGLWASHCRLPFEGDDERKGGNRREGEQGRCFASGASANMPVHARLLESHHPLLLAL